MAGDYGNFGVPVTVRPGMQSQSPEAAARIQSAINAELAEASNGENDSDRYGDD